MISYFNIIFTFSVINCMVAGGGIPSKAKITVHGEPSTDPEETVPYVATQFERRESLKNHSKLL